jgi:hypothetical protein
MPPTWPAGRDGADLARGAASDPPRDPPAAIRGGGCPGRLARARLSVRAFPLGWELSPIPPVAEPGIGVRGRGEEFPWVPLGTSEDLSPDRGDVGRGNSELSGCADTVRRTTRDAPLFGGSHREWSCKTVENTKVARQSGPSAQEFTRSGKENRAQRPCYIGCERDTGATQTWSACRFQSPSIGARQNGFRRGRGARHLSGELHAIPALRDDIQDLRARVEELTERIDELLKRPVEPNRHRPEDNHVPPTPEPEPETAVWETEDTEVL